METLMDFLSGLSGTTLLIVVGLLAFGEAAAFVGLFVPGEIAVVLGGVLAAQGRVSLPALVTVVASAAVAGDSAGYEIGRRWGPALLRSRPLRHRLAAVARAETSMQRWGWLMVVAGRWTSVLRAVVPGLAGMSRMPYPRFLAANVVGGVAWAVAFSLLGASAGHAYHRVEAVTGRASWVVAGVVVVVVALRATWQRASRVST